MILYDNSRLLGYSQYFHVFGSAIFTWRSAPQSVVGAAVGYYATQNSAELTDYIVNPTAYFSAISLVLGFLLVFRTQLAYMRYWEGRTSFQTLMSKLEDVGIHTKTFVRLNDSEAIKWKNAMGHMLINYLALAMAELRGERDLDDVVTKYNLSLTPDQREELEAFSYRAYIAMSWIMDAWVKRATAGGVTVSPPVQSRTYQNLSEAQLAFNAAQKIQSTPFPYPFVQVCGMLLNVYMFSAPLVIGAYINHFLFGTLLSCFSVLGFFALNRTADELEDPFGNDPNDLPLDHYLCSFQESMISLGILQYSELQVADDATTEAQVSPQGATKEAGAQLLLNPEGDEEAAHAPRGSKQFTMRQRKAERNKSEYFVYLR